MARQRETLARALEVMTAYYESPEAELFDHVWDAQVAEHGLGEAAVGLIEGLLTLNGLLLQRLEEGGGRAGLDELAEIATALHARPL